MSLPCPRPDRSIGPWTRRGFTLVELLIVIVIIALLMGMLTLGIGAAIRRTQQAAVIMEIEQMSNGMQAYKDAHGSFPPSFAAYDNPTNAYRALITRHLANAFPQYIRDADEDGDHDYDDFRQDVLDGTSDYDTANFPDGLDVNTLDQAEALVFWLGGFPSRTTESRLVGFSLNQRNPFENDTVQPQRTTRHFAFETDRLRDLDEDGWLEYVPNLEPPTGEMSPYVYFDSATYTAWTAPGATILLASYPSDEPAAVRGGLTASAAATNIQQWGRCWPMWRVDPAENPPDPAQWVNSDSFQIICAGEDGAYSLTEDPPTDPATFPHLDEPEDPDDPILDNLANFADDTMEEVHSRHEDEHE
jgi:prepilin-type N-terminal cleavage/methylation domain-containing protein